MTDPRKKPTKLRKPFFWARKQRPTSDAGRPLCNIESVQPEERPWAAHDRVARHCEALRLTIPHMSLRSMFGMVRLPSDKGIV